MKTIIGERLNMYPHFLKWTLLAVRSHYITRSLITTLTLALMGGRTPDDVILTDIRVQYVSTLKKSFLKMSTVEVQIKNK